MAELVTFGVKMSQEQRDALSQLQEKSGASTAAEFMQLLAANFEAAKARETVADETDIRALDHHLARISELFLSMAKSRRDLKDAAGQAQVEKSQEITSLKAQLIDLQRQSESDLRTATVMVEEAEAACRAAADKQVEAQTERDKAVEERQQLSRMFEKLDALNQQLMAQAEEAKNTATEQVKTAEMAATARIEAEREQSTRAMDKIHALNQQLTAQIEATQATAAEHKAAAEQSAKEKAALERQLQFLQLTHRQALLAAEEKALETRKSLLDEVERLRQELAATKLLTKPEK